MRGAGQWYTTLHGNGVGVYGNWAPHPSSAVHLADFAIFGEVTDRDDSAQVNGLGGALGGGSTVDSLWIQHTKVGGWFDGPFDGLALTRLRILGQTADGVNFHNGISHASVSDSYIRGTGDDGLAMWGGGDAADYADAFRHNTVVAPVLANNIVVYGGHDNSVTDNLVTDTLTQGGGIHVGNRFGAIALAGVTTIARNRLVRSGVLDPNWQFGVGAIWFWAADSPMTGTIALSDNEILDSSYEAVQFIGSSITNVHFDDDVIDGTGTFGLQLQSAGSATFHDVSARHLGAGGRYDCGSGFAVTLSGHTRGLADAHCGFPSPGPLVLGPGALGFGRQLVGTVGPSQTVTVTNPGHRPVRLASVTATGTFRESDTCGDVLAPQRSCAVTLRFAPNWAGARVPRPSPSAATAAPLSPPPITSSTRRSTPTRRRSPSPRRRRDT